SRHSGENLNSERLRRRRGRWGRAGPLDRSKLRAHWIRCSQEIAAMRNFDRIMTASGPIGDITNSIRSLIGAHEQRLVNFQAALFLATRYVRTKGIKSQFPNGIVSSVLFVSTTSTARSLAGFVLLALALTPWRSPDSSEKLCPAL